MTINLIAMSIKSEKAKEYFAKNRVSPCIGEDDKIDGVIRAKDGSFMYADSAQRAVEIAESDARERAVRVFCKTVCPKQHEGCSCYGLSCDKRDEFLKHYDQ